MKLAYLNTTYPNGRQANGNPIPLDSANCYARHLNNKEIYNSTTIVKIIADPTQEDFKKASSYIDHETRGINLLLDAPECDIAKADGLYGDSTSSPPTHESLRNKLHYISLMKNVINYNL